MISEIKPPSDGLRRKVAFMYPGQGAQYFHMGIELFRAEPRFRKSMRQCDEMAAPFLHRSMLQNLHGNEYGKSDTFPSLELSNVALLSIEYSLARLLMDFGLHPDLHLGYSLGEFAAGVIANAISLEEAIWLVIEFAKVVAETVPPGKMLAVLDSVSVMERYAPEFVCYMLPVNYGFQFPPGRPGGRRIQCQFDPGAAGGIFRRRASGPPCPVKR